MPLIPQVPENLFKSGMLKARRRAHAMKKGTGIVRREIYQVEAFGSYVNDKLVNFVNKTAGFDSLAPFTGAVAKQLVDVNKVKKSLGALAWAGDKVQSLATQYKKNMRKHGVRECIKMRKQFEARVESILKQVRPNIKELDRARYKLRKMPSIKDMPTVVIAGYPNVGKSTILRCITDSQPRVQPYPFTTQSILIGYTKKRFKRIQVVDTPGILDRPSEKLNKMEKQALAAIKHLGNKMLFVMDYSGACGYTIEEQRALLKSLKKATGAQALVVASKIDLLARKTGGLGVTDKDPRTMKALKDKLFEWVLA